MTTRTINDMDDEYYGGFHDESDEENEENEYCIPSYESPNSKHRIALRGYSGYVPKQNKPADVIDEPYHRIMIRGYSGYLNGTINVCGKPLIPSVDEQKEKLNLLSQKNATGKNSPLRSAGHVQDKVEQSTLGSSFTNFRSYGKHMELEERYNNAIQQLWKRGQTQQMLLRMVQSKLSERINSYADQHVRARKLYDYFDLDNSQTLDEHEFRQFLELSNCYMDDIQSLALFAYFDSDRIGGITWESFSEHALVHNPRGGTAVIPKAITATMKSDDWQSAAKPRK
eukprot:CAMPEP_0185035564 /NCGR_PEP_ID=MMETSP1103-20130426/27172_1 /TAXON_ID=36769 /ORGANISM="Paraphysomonas bandaiensis, Strain Caron Lab Isolate" /LENGTH=283 /DNA_ID=CAMNT_0027572703 /DNA_START=30 /DNA_END=881 /DNA_ORIENTATION=+